MAYLQSKNEAVSHEMIQHALDGEMNRVTIYRILKSFEEDGIVHKVMSDDGVLHFALCNDCDHDHSHQHNHIHFRCTQCNTVECLDEKVSLNLPDGYKVSETNLLVKGYCAQCTQ